MSRRKTDMRALNAKVCKSGKEFNDALMGLLDATGDNAKVVCKGKALELYTSLVEATPKDTGRAAGGFNISEEPLDWVPPKNVRYSTGEPDKKDRRLRQEFMAKQTENWLNISIDSKTTISNNVEYLPYLEDGHSSLQPTGFIANTLHDWAKSFEEGVEELNKKKIR